MWRSAAGYQLTPPAAAAPQACPAKHSPLCSANLLQMASLLTRVHLDDPPFRRVPGCNSADMRGQAVATVALELAALLKQAKIVVVDCTERRYWVEELSYAMLAGALVISDGPAENLRWAASPPAPRCCLTRCRTGRCRRVSVGRVGRARRYLHLGRGQPPCVLLYFRRCCRHAPS